MHALFALIVSYSPAFYYYNTHSTLYNDFIQRVSHKYRDKIKDE